MPEGVVLVSAVRTAIGRFGRAFRDISAQRLGALVIKEAVRRAGIRLEDVDEVIMGNVISAGLGQNPARQAAIYAGIPVETGAFTVNKVCGSGLKAVVLAGQAIKSGDAGIIVAGGMENMSASPHIIRSLRWGMKLGDAMVADTMIHDGLWDVYNDYHMAITGERIAVKYGITREEADRFAFMSHEKALGAIENGGFREEILPVEVGGTPVERDECVREDTSIEKLSKLQPVFKKDGILTAGNSSKLSDGAAALIVTSARKAKELGIKPLARITGYATGGTRPEDVMEAPIPTVRKLLKRTGLTIGDIDLVEHNEAYSTASIAVSRELGIDPERFNVKGGAVAMGHPIGCSGARILVTLLYALQERGLERGLATLCLGGGNAVAMIVER
ncbi:MAG TPA: acetyl-CoA C-acetyltransferase [Thermodesulfovibrionales bacterium]|nr:acetyl-CoA C-acetyltransferase [Thermodesulfovibrionales bacterium]